VRRVASAVAMLALAGLLLLADIHPEARESWRDGMAFATPMRDSNDYAIALIEAGLDRKPLRTF
jgi:hypothetical protein